MGAFAGFWCRKCGGRVFEDDPYKDGNGVPMTVLSCLLCAKTHQVETKRYRHLLTQIENAIRKKRSASEKQILPRPERNSRPSLISNG
jgi:hypothetical protein